MRVALLGWGLCLAAAAAVIWVTGTRIIVIQPIGAIPDGVTAIVTGVHDARFIDSPDAMCQRRQGGVSLLCRGMSAAAVARDGNIVARLPYSETLFWMSGAPKLAD